ncbi:MAG: rRNA maturation RNase YbeY, partial [Verrucomicrobiae bacterium]|nr:rRNA maturation RNase YbeY [Verrucomicrobiae bacterium]
LQPLQRGTRTPPPGCLPNDQRQMTPIIFTRNRQRKLRIRRGWLTELAAAALTELNSPLKELGIVLLNDAQIAEYNRRFHHRDGPTDILTFHYEGIGELMISTQQAIANARRFRTTPRRELALYVIHGILHLHGYDDRTPAQRRRMRAAERRLLAALL